MCRWGLLILTVSWKHTFLGSFKRQIQPDRKLKPHLQTTQNQIKKRKEKKIKLVFTSKRTVHTKQPQVVSVGKGKNSPSHWGLSPFQGCGFGPNPKVPLRSWAMAWSWSGNTTALGHSWSTHWSCWWTSRAPSSFPEPQHPSEQCFPWGQVEDHGGHTLWATARAKTKTTQCILVNIFHLFHYVVGISRKTPEDH